MLKNWPILYNFVHLIENLRIRNALITNGFLHQRRKKIIFHKARMIKKKKNHFHTGARYYVLLEIMKQDEDVKVRCGFQSRENIGSRKQSHTAYKVWLPFPLTNCHRRAAASPVAEFYK